MNKKILIQIFLFFIIFLSLWFYYYFYKNNKINDKVSKKNNTEVLITDDSANVIKNIFYTSTDSLGNKFEIKAKTGKVKLSNQNLVYMNDVTAIVKLVNSSPININSKSAEYNKKNHETKFKENILINHLDHNIKTENLYLSFEKNLATAYDKVIYSNNNTKLYADMLEIDLITKNSKIFMDNKTEKIKIINKK
jgi:hypothetical protein